MGTNEQRGYSIRIFLPDGEADGFKIVEKSNWNGRGVVCPRAMFPDNSGRDEFGRTGIYILIGSLGFGDLPTVYIGQGDPVRPRMVSHYGKKGFWTVAIFFVGKDDGLNKAHIGHIESRLITLATEAKRCNLDNINAPVLPSMSEMDVADAEGFLDELLLCLPVLGVDVFSKPDRPSKKDELFLSGKDAEATGYESSEGFVVRAGAIARGDETASIGESISKFRKSLVERGIFVRDRTGFRVAQDYSFTSPSLAAAAILGRSANGRVMWKDAQGVTLKDIQGRSAGTEV